MALHKNIPFACNHTSHSKEYADITARTTVSGVETTDIGRIARQLDDDTFWLLTDVDGGGNSTWIPLGLTADNDVNVKVSANDTTTGYLNGKIVTTSGILLTEINDAGNETFDISIGSHQHTESEIIDLQSYLLNINSELLSDLDDTLITSVGANEILQWDGTDWINQTFAEAGISGTGHAHAHSATTGQGTDDHHAKLHAADHKTGGADEIDGDQLDIDWNPTNYTPSTTPTEASSIDNLTAHLYGIDQVLANAGGLNDIHLSFNGGRNDEESHDYSRTESNTFKSMGKFIFRGTTTLGTPANIKVIIQGVDVES